ncbi:MAG: hypothetical protein FWG27_08940 [Treponema sp.]|nr:hypothetical protein [Treponema sp.]
MKKLCLIFLAGTLLCSCTTITKNHGSDSYYVYAGGSDRNDGLSEEKPFRSLFKAMAVAVKSSIKTITVIGTLDITSEQSSNMERVFFIQGMGKNTILIRGKKSDADPAVLSADGSGRRAVLVRGTVPIRFENIEISGGITSGEGGGLGIGPGSTVILGPGAVIRNNQSDNVGGGVLVFGGSLFIDGGKISGNRSAVTGGGVAAAGQNCILVFKSGEISNNQAQGGGGVAVYQGSRFTLSGGIIHDNTADMAGGGVMVNQQSSFTMEGGGVRGNRSSGSGGGIVLLDGSSFVLEDGEILGNIAAEHGGGIAADHTGIIAVQGGFIIANRAAEHGGGVFTAGTFVKSAGKIYGRDMPEDAANMASSGAAVFIYREGFFKTREASAGEDLVLDASADDGWVVAEE